MSLANAATLTSPLALPLGSRCVVLLSGGLDSAVSLAALCNTPGTEVLRAVFVDYGQRNKAKELTAATSLAQHYGVPLQVLSLDWLAALLPEGMKHGGDALSPTTVHQVWVPNRNGVLLHMGAALAEGHGASHVAFGANLDEAESGFPDNGQAFWELMNQTLARSTRTGVKLLAPVGTLRKTEIVALGVALQVPFEHVWSCYENGLGPEQNLPCGVCASCQHLRRGLAANGVTMAFANDEPHPIATVG